MLLQTNSYIVPKEKRAEHVRLLRRFRHALAKLGCDNFEVYEQVGANWSSGEPTGRYVQIMRFRDRRHQLSVQAAERTDPTAQAIIAEFCQLINFPYQQQQGLFAVGFYNAVLQAPPARAHAADVAAAAASLGPGVMEAAEAEQQAAEPVEGPAGEHEDYVPAAEASAEAEPESPLAGETLAEVDANAGEALDEPAAEESSDPEAEMEAAAGEAEEDAAPPFAEGEAGPETLDDELGALLDAHLDEGADDSGASPEDAPDAAGDAPVDKFEALDALDIDDLELPDSPLADPEQRQNHVAR